MTMTPEEREAQVRRLAARIFGGTPVEHEDGDPLLDPPTGLEDPYWESLRDGSVDRP